MDESVNQEHFYYALLLPRWLIAPDGTILFPKILDCGCKLTNELDENLTAKPAYIEIIVESCKKHEEELKAKSFESNFTWRKGDMIHTKMHDDY